MLQVESFEPTAVASLPVPQPLSASSRGIADAVMPGSPEMPRTRSMEVTPQYQLQKHAQYAQYGMQQDKHAHVQQDNHSALLQGTPYTTAYLHDNTTQYLHDYTTEYLHHPELQPPLGIYILKHTY